MVKVSLAPTTGLPPALVWVLEVVALTVPPWGHMSVLSVVSSALIVSSHDFQCAVVDVDFGVADLHGLRPAGESNAIGIESDAVSVGVLNGDAVLIVIEQDLVLQGDNRFHRVGGVGGNRLVQPESSHPNGIRGIAGFELDPNFGIHLR